MTMWSIYIKKSRARLILISAMSIIMFASCTINTNEIKTISSGGTVYRGQTHNGKREGLGMLYQGDSVLYSGMWHNGMRQGRGTVRDHDGKLIDGVWDHDTLVTATRRDSTGVYDGEMDEKFRANGYGKFIDSLNTYYEGQWKDGERTGFGFSSQQIGRAHV